MKSFISQIQALRIDAVLLIRETQLHAESVRTFRKFKIARMKSKQIYLKCVYGYKLARTLLKMNSVLLERS